MTLIASFKQEVTELVGNGKGRSLGIIAGGWGILIGTRMIYPVVLPYLRTSFGFSLTIAGLLVSLLWLGSALGQLPSGMLADRYSERLVMTAGTVIVAGALGLVVTAPSPLLLFAATGLVGLGQSLYPIARITILSDIYPDRIGSALGVTMATGDLGQTVFPPIAAALAAATVWQVGLGFPIPLLLVVAVALWVVLPAQQPATGEQESMSIGKLPTVVARLRRENLLFVAFILFLYILIWQSFTGLYPTYLVDVKGLSSEAAGFLFSVFFAFGVVVKPIAGAVYDRIGMRRSLILVLIGPVAGFVLLPLIHGFWTLGATTALVSTMLGAGTITQSFLSDTIPDDIQGTGIGMVRTTSATFGAAGPVLFGGLADLGFFDEGYLLLALLLVIVILITLRLPEVTA